ncbi:Serine carboxypeptidase 3 [Elasticomyces elasticus]|nr:Serine carboxypeptidase 3 [Elasticomyces elasticus]KAK3662545.1 Serine carboxypeptidase 3 [Elasticomyces elasticus]KAK4927888.1 Serine carboxypeptidase 3 [Elasticomyces elasticus]KAK5750236.1 Serine carboxypeptidase 3 [Elasticomyces elasticus]
MAASSVCSSCIRALRQQAPKVSRTAQRQHLLSPRAFTTSTRALDAKAPPPPAANAPPPSSPAGFAQLASTLRHSPLRKTAVEPYIAYGSTEDLFRACSAQCSYTIPSVLATPPEPAPKNAAEEDVGVGEGWWVEPKSAGGLGLDVTFNTWAQVVMLHIGIWHQNLLDHFFYAAEDRMAMWHGMSARGVRNKYLKDLWLQWRGLMLSYDEGLIKGDAALAAAVWRNLFKARVDADVNIEDIAVVAAYLRKELQKLGEMTDEEISVGKVVFGSPKSVKQLLAKNESPWMRKSFTAEDLKGLEVEEKK